MSHSTHSEVVPVRKPADYWPDHIDIEKNDWLFTYDNLNQSVSRKDDMPRSEELRSYDLILNYYLKIMRYLVLKSKGPDGQYKPDSLPKSFVFYSMLYVHRYFQRESLKTGDFREVSTIIAFISARVIERHRKLEDLVSFHLSYFYKDTMGTSSPKYWSLKERLESLELRVMARLCFDFIISLPYAVLKEFSECEEIYHLGQTLDRPAVERLHKITTGHFEKATRTQIYLLYSVEEIILFLLGYSCAIHQYQLSSKFFENSTHINSFDFEKALKFYTDLTELNTELSKTNLSAGPIEEFNITEEQLKYIIKIDESVHDAIQTQVSDEDKPIEDDNKESKPMADNYSREREEDYRTPMSSRPTTSWLDNEEQGSISPYKSTYSKDESCLQAGLTPNNCLRTPVHPSKTPNYTPKSYAVPSNATTSSKTNIRSAASLQNSKSVHSPVISDPEAKSKPKSELTSSRLCNNIISSINKTLSGVAPIIQGSESERNKEFLPVEENLVAKTTDKSENLNNHSEKGGPSLNDFDKASEETEGVGQVRDRPETIEATVKDPDVDMKDAHFLGDDEAEDRKKIAEVSQLVQVVKDQEKHNTMLSESMESMTNTEYDDSMNEQMKAKIDGEQERTEQHVKLSIEEKVGTGPTTAPLSKGNPKNTITPSALNASKTTAKDFLSGKIKASRTKAFLSEQVPEKRFAPSAAEQHGNKKQKTEEGLDASRLKILKVSKRRDAHDEENILKPNETEEKENIKAVDVSKNSSGEEKTKNAVTAQISVQKSKQREAAATTTQGGTQRRSSRVSKKTVLNDESELSALSDVSTVNTPEKKPNKRSAANAKTAIIQSTVAPEPKTTEGGPKVAVKGALNRITKDSKANGRQKARGPVKRNVRAKGKGSEVSKLSDAEKTRRIQKLYENISDGLSDIED